MADRLDVERSTNNLPILRSATPTNSELLRAFLSSGLDHAKSLFASNTAPREKSDKALLPNWAVGAGRVATAIGLLATIHQEPSPVAAQVTQISPDDPRFKPQTDVLISTTGALPVRQETDGDQEPSEAPAPAIDAPAFSIGGGQVEAEAANMAGQLSKEAIESKRAELRQYEIKWSKDTDPDPEIRAAATDLLYGLAALQSAPGAIGDTGKFIEEMLKKQNRPDNGGNLQFDYYTPNFGAGYMFTITNRPYNPDNPDDSSPITYALVNNMPIVDGRVQSIILLQFNPAILIATQGRLPNGAVIDLDTAYVGTAQIGAAQEINRKLLTEANARRGNATNLQPALMAKRSEVEPAAQEEAASRALNSAVEIYKELSNEVYAGPALREKMGL